MASTGPDERGERYRWELSAEEAERVQEVRGSRMRLRDIARAHVRRPSLIRHTARTMITSAAGGLRGDPVLAWVVHADRIRRVVPEVASGVEWHGHEEFVEVLEPHLREDVVALELGIGAGRIARRVAGRIARLEGTDISIHALEEARASLSSHENIGFHRVAGYHLATFPDASFDLVYSHDVFLVFDVNQALALLDEAHRVLRPGGVLVVSFYTIDRPAWAAAQVELVRRAARDDRFTGVQPRAYTAGQVDALCEAAGLSVVDSRYGEPRLASDPDGRRHYIVTARRD